jgi:hypothetical protein
VTPFDAVALVVMLETFYPTVTRAALERAFRERPDYFAGGTLIGRHSDALKLQDGRIFDIVFAAWTPISRWQALDVTHAEDGTPDPFALEEGPLVPIDIDGILPPTRASTFESLMGEALRDLGASESVLEQAARDVAALDQGATLDADYADTVAHSAAALEGDIIAMETIGVSELVEQSDGLTHTTQDRRIEYAVDPNAPEPPVLDETPRTPPPPDEGRPPEA